MSKIIEQFLNDEKIEAAKQYTQHSVAMLERGNGRGLGFAIECSGKT